MEMSENAVLTDENFEKQDATRRWVETTNSAFSDCDDHGSEVSSVVESFCDTTSETDDDVSLEKPLGQSTEPRDLYIITEEIRQLFSAASSVQTVGNVKIDNSTGVHIGNITNINGDINITYAGRRNSGSRRSKRKPKNSETEERQSTLDPRQEHEERVSREAFISDQKFKFPKGICKIKPRHSWLAQTPLEEVELLNEPVQYVVISHTATESSEKQAINVRLIRDIQCFHIESREWNDIAYNFLIGCDGFVYEGRGWGVIGAHTLGYNSRSIGISFIGCFMRVLPTMVALEACKNLLKRGVEEGHLAPDYKLICHCQCSSTESPGKKLFEEIQRWEHFYNIEDEAE